ncbi:hypothetical protein [Hydrogenimonas urashimensis]|uniref:hypothetical protein n=1 Tax=Hydrogenimonas urashimensis TaxID=2740515 RepID=UPI00191517D2|nr:hypothetical protein [Hydrogenimonas urashimensis]
MKKIIVAALFALATAALAEETVQYDATTYGPSDTVVHYDNDRQQDENRNQTNVPNNDVYPQTDK